MVLIEQFYAYDVNAPCRAGVQADAAQSWDIVCWKKLDRRGQNRGPSTFSDRTGFQTQKRDGRNSPEDKERRS